MTVQVTQEQGATSCHCNLQITFGDQRPELPVMMITRHGDIPITTIIIVYSRDPHWLSGAKESHVPSHRHQRVPDH